MDFSPSLVGFLSVWPMKSQLSAVWQPSSSRKNISDSVFVARPMLFSTWNTLYANCIATTYPLKALRQSNGFPDPMPCIHPGRYVCESSFPSCIRDPHACWWSVAQWLEEARRIHTIFIQEVYTSWMNNATETEIFKTHDISAKTIEVMKFKGNKKGTF